MVTPFVLVVKTVFVMEDHPKSLKICLLVDLGLGAMAFPVVEFSREGYKIRKVFG